MACICWRCSIFSSDPVTLVAHSARDPVAEQFERPPMRDTEPFTPARVRVQDAGAARVSAVHTTPEVKCVQSGANVDESDVAPSLQSFPRSLQVTQGLCGSSSASPGEQARTLLGRQCSRSC